MICPCCGTLVSDDARVCPACHYRLGGKRPAVSDEARWCASCGSLIPAGHDVCAVCGMPVEGAFDKEPGERLSVGKVVHAPAKEDDTELMSAIPPAPKRGEDVALTEGRPQRIRLMLAAAIAALVLVGGTTLYIVKPWDPNAYSTRATVAADTSMEGFPGERTYLSAQDRAEEAQRQAELDEAQRQIDEAYARLGELMEQVELAHDVIEDYLSTGSAADSATPYAATVATQRELDSLEEQLRRIGEEHSDYVERCDETLVLLGYLRGATDVLARSWGIVNQGDSPETVFYVRSLLEGEMGERGYDEWHELFVNAYKSLA